MYEKHIENLKAIARNYPEGDQPTFDAAIALMRAAEPQDESAEREHCERVVADHLGDWQDIGPHVDLIERERAAARAEGYSISEGSHAAEMRDIDRARNNEAEMIQRYISQITEARAALKAADRKLHLAVADSVAAEDKLKAANERIAELETSLARVRGVLEADHTQFRASQAVIDELSTQLTALREAAERFLRSQHWRDNYAEMRLFSAAIEASKK